MPDDLAPPDVAAPQAEVLQSLLQQVSELVVIVDQEHRVVFSNRVAERATKDLTGGAFEELFLPADRSVIKDTVDDLFAAGDGARQELKIGLSVSKPSARFELRLSIFSGVDGQQQLAAVARDFDDSQRLAALLGESEARLRSIISHARPITFVLDKDGVFVVSEGRDLAKLGLAPGEVVGQSALDLYANAAPIAQAIECALGGESFSDVVDLGDATFDFFVSPMQDDDGHVNGVVGMAMDITERQAAQKALRASEHRFRTLLENAPEAIVILDVERGCYADVNDKAEKLYGLSRAELFERNPVQLSPTVQPDGRPSDAAAGEYIEAALAGETPVFEWTHLHSSGAELPVEVRLVRLPDPTRLLVRGSLIDITARKAAERDREKLRQHLQDAQKMEALGQLTGGVAHDFNNLLTVIIGNLEFARHESREPPAADSPIEQAMSASMRAAAMTQRLLAFSRKQALQPKSVNLNALIDGMNQLLRQAVGETVDIEQRLAPDVWECAVDPAQMENAILNLALNARDAMPGGGSLILETSNSDCTNDTGSGEDISSGDHIRLTVSDTGIGMSAEVRSQVFEPFFTTKGVGEGSGLGLSMVYGFVKQSNGRLSIASEPGSGTVVTILLPRSSAELPGDAPMARKTDVQHGNGEVVLVVEDDADVRRLSVRLIQSLGYRTLEAAEAAEALRILDHGARVDVLFSDVVLPGGVSGVQLARIATQRYPELRVLYTSGYTQDKFATGDDSFPLIQKPFATSTVAERLAQILQDRSIASSSD